MKTLRKGFGDLEIDALLVTHPADIRYLTGFRGDDSHLVVGTNRAVVISDFRFEEELGAVGPEVAVHIYMRTGSITDADKEVVEGLKAGKVGIQAEHVSVAMRARLAKALGAKRLRDVTGVLSTQRMVKDAHEVKLIQRAVRVQEAALLATLETIEPGQTEREVCARLEYEMKVGGA
ncbi:MAG: aminopeptidase P family N-terminal domain-containing protein, partial [Planctomycetota bacterium]|nr:aminopeptidase P family N-terminal domain-containing protein [Planctomycetota bacterium]